MKRTAHPRVKNRIPRRVEDLKAWERNPRQIGDRELKGLQTSLEEFGDLSGVVWNLKNKSLVCGHQRLRALKEQYGPGLRIEGSEIVTPKGERFPIRVVSWDEKMHMAANVAANNPHIAGEFTQELAKILDELKIDLPDLSEMLNLNILRADHPSFWNTGEIVEDEVPDPPKKSRTRPGDLYELGGHRLLCGDATVRRDVERLMGRAKARMVFTDPPYNVDYGNKNVPGHKARTIAGDKQTDREWEQFCKSIFSHFKDFSTGDIYMWGASGPAGMRMRLWLVDSGCHWSATIIWKKQQMILSPGKYQRIYEPCFYGWFNKSSYAGDRKQVEVWDIDRPFRSEEHPTMKPLALCARGISNSSTPGDVVLDLFAGSGSTLIAAEQVGRKCYTMELEPGYCDVVLTRYVRLTGKKKVRLNGKEITWSPT